MFRLFSDRFGFYALLRSCFFLHVPLSRSVARLLGKKVEPFLLENKTMGRFGMACKEIEKKHAGQERGAPHLDSPLVGESCPGGGRALWSGALSGAQDARSSAGSLT